MENIVINIFSKFSESSLDGQAKVNHTGIRAGFPSEEYIETRFVAGTERPVFRLVASSIPGRNSSHHTCKKQSMLPILRL